MTMHKTTMRFDDAPAWDCDLVIGGQTFSLVSPLLVEASLSPTPTPDQAAIDELTRRRAGVFRRLWWWLAGDPRRVRAADLPTDGGAAHTLLVARAIVAPHQRPLLGELSGGQVAALVACYMSAQGSYFEAVGAWAAAQAGEGAGAVLGGVGGLGGGHGPSAMGNGRAPDRVVPLHAGNMVEMLTQRFGPPSNGYATGITPDTAPGFGDNGHVDGLAGGAS